MNRETAITGTAASKEAVEDLINNTREDLVQKFNIGWRPSSWLSFILLGLPAGSKTLLTMGGGQALAGTEAAQTHGRDLRRMEKGNAAKPVPGRPVDTKPPLAKKAKTDGERDLDFDTTHKHVVVIKRSDNTT